MLRHWGGVPQTTAGLLSWAETVAHTRADTDPRVVDANRDAEQTHRDQQRLAARREGERAALRCRIPRNLLPSSVEASAAAWRGHAEQSRSDLAEIEALPVIEAAQIIRDHAARAEAERVVAERAQQRVTREPPSSPGPTRPRSTVSGPVRGTTTVSVYDTGRFLPGVGIPPYT